MHYAQIVLQPFYRIYSATEKKKKWINSTVEITLESEFNQPLPMIEIEGEFKKISSSIISYGKRARQIR